MAKIIEANQPFVRKEHSIAEAREMFSKMGQKYKLEIIDALAANGATSVSSYSEGEFVDLCRGPHVKYANNVKAVKLLSIAGAYWRGDQKNAQLQRIYGTAFKNKTQLQEHLTILEEAKKRDHRKLGKELELVTFIPEAPASPFFLPKGAIIYNRLVQLMRDLYVPYGYDEVITPQIFDVQLWKTSGHYDNYRENMYFVRTEDQQEEGAHSREFGIKPMNCPAHTYVFASSKRSYRDLPLRIADFGRLHRYEASGATAGLTRVRTFCQDDAHIFCMPEQIESEIKKVIQMILKVYDLFGFTDVKIALSTRPEKSADGAHWSSAEDALKRVLDSTGMPYEFNRGDGAFYGPKIDFQVKDALKRPHQLGTIQLDFILPERFGLSYVSSDNTAIRPVMVHRAVLGSLERFIGVAIEHYAGAFPFWLAPVQARVVPITDAHVAYAKEFQAKLKAMGIRVDIDDRNESMGLKTRDAQMSKIPFALVAGDRDVQGNQFAVRKYGEQASKNMTQDEIIALFKELNAVPDRTLRS